jgi:hypothetical protein
LLLNRRVALSRKGRGHVDQRRVSANVFARKSELSTQ